MLGCKHGHLVRVHVLTAIVVDDRLHRLLVILTAVIAIDMVALDVDHAGALTEFSADLEPLLNLVFIEAGCPVVRLHFGEAAALGARLGDCAVTILVLLVHQFDLRLQVLVRVWRDFRYLVYYG